MLRRSFKRKGTAVPTHTMKELFIRNLDTIEVRGQTWVPAANVYLHGS